MSNLVGNAAISERGGLAWKESAMLCVDERFADLAREDTPFLGAVFSYPNLRVVLVNKTGRRLLLPSYMGVENDFDFGLRDLISLESQSMFEARVFPMTQLTGRWQGSIELRDIWGGSLSVEGVFWTERSGPTGREKFLCLRATPRVGKSFDQIRGWRDRELLLALLAHSDDAIYFKDQNSRFLRASHSLTRRFGLKHPHEVIGKTDFDFFDLEHAVEAYQDERRILETGEAMLDKEEREIWTDNSVTWASTSKLPLRDAQGKVIGTLGVSRDITQRKLEERRQKELEARLQLAQRLEAIGSLAAGVAHEINTPTQFVADNARFLSDAFGDLERLLDLLQRFIEKSEGLPTLEALRAEAIAASEEVDVNYIRKEIPDTLSQSMEGLEQIGRIVGSLREFSYPSTPEKTKADLNRAIENTVNVSRNEWKLLAEMELDLDPELPEVSCLVDQISQVALNLIVNAAHAIETANRGHGVIGVQTRRDGDFVCIEISDTGDGIPWEIRERIFEPYFTTKAMGKGTGQGLAIARNVVVTTHGGELDFESVIGEGTTFIVRLPINAEATAESEDSGDTETDEDSIR